LGFVVCKEDLMTNQPTAEATPLRRIIDQYFEAWRGSTPDTVLRYFSDDAVVTLLGDGATDRKSVV
jgi:hypothetical protein